MVVVDLYKSRLSRWLRHLSLLWGQLPVLNCLQTILPHAVGDAVISRSRRARRWLVSGITWRLRRTRKCEASSFTWCLRRALAGEVGGVARCQSVCSCPAVTGVTSGIAERWRHRFANALPAVYIGRSPVPGRTKGTNHQKQPFWKIEYLKIAYLQAVDTKENAKIHMGSIQLDKGTPIVAYSCLCVDSGHWRASFVRKTGVRLFLCSF